MTKNGVGGAAWAQPEPYSERNKVSSATFAVATATAAATAANALDTSINLSLLVHQDAFQQALYEKDRHTDPAGRPSLLYVPGRRRLSKSPPALQGC